jgi:hypothetical protein
MKAKDFKKMIANIPDEMNVEFMAKIRRIQNYLT